MKKNKILFLSAFISIWIFGCSSLTTSEPLFFKPDNPNIHYVGRIDFNEPLSPKLSGAGSYINILFKGSSCEIIFTDQKSDGNYNYLAIILDGEYKGRIKLSEDEKKYSVAQNLKDTLHTLLICKATEAQNGYAAFGGLICQDVVEYQREKKKRIEFIGNSITCGMGLDLSEVPCDSGQWYDQHNAYFSYAPLSARALNCEWLLSSVSGIGIERNWNSPGPTMPAVYKNLYLNTDSSKIWNYKEYSPDLISICLGQNDFSDGDGSYDRAELDSAKFVNAYIKFVKFIRRRNPGTPILILSSPMISDDKRSTLCNYLSAVQNYFANQIGDANIHKYFFKQSYNNGCSTHPDKAEHELIAVQVMPFYQKLLK